IFLAAAINLIARVYGSVQLAEQELRRALKDELVRWRCRLLEGDGGRWNLPTAKPGRSRKLWRYVHEVRWTENWARMKYLDGCTIGLIEVVEADVPALLPFAGATTENKTDSELPDTTRNANALETTTTTNRRPFQRKSVYQGSQRIRARSVLKRLFP